MCFLRGQIYLRLSRGEKAKEAFLEALALDVKCFEAFNLLVQNQMLTIGEGRGTFQPINDDIFIILQNGH
jgi:anaphase-promoting complex subunit 6